MSTCSQCQTSPVYSKSVVKEAVVKAADTPVKQKAQVAKKHAIAPPTKSILRKEKSPKITFVPDDIGLCISDLAKHYNINTSIPACAAGCKYMHDDLYSSTTSKNSVLTKVQQLGDNTGKVGDT
jgi:hypothetical protein